MQYHLNEHIKKHINEIISSKNELHLTIYIPQTSSIQDLRNYLKKARKEATQYLSKVLNKQEELEFLAPIIDLSTNYLELKKYKHSIGIFRTKNKFRILSLPIDVPYTMITATSFHIKPLLDWIQFEKDFYLLGLGENYACLYRCNQTENKIIEKIHYPESMIIHKEDTFDIQYEKEKKKIHHFIKMTDWMTEWLMGIVNEEKRFLYLAGREENVKILLKKLPYSFKSEVNQNSYFTEEIASEIIAKIRRNIKREAYEEIQSVIDEYHNSTSENKSKRNIFQIAKAAVAGRVKKLIISKEKKIFGKIDKKTGGMSIHYDHLDHEDDDLLDDIAQIVMEKGGQVYVADNKQVPKGQAIMAILKPNKAVLESA